MALRSIGDTKVPLLGASKSKFAESMERFFEAGEDIIPAGAVRHDREGSIEIYPSIYPDMVRLFPPQSLKG